MPRRRAPALNTEPPSPERAAALAERIVRLEEERRTLASDIKDIFAEAKSAGVDLAGLRLAVKRHLETPEKREAREAAEESAEQILAALGQLADTPLGAAVSARAAA